MLVHIRAKIIAVYMQLFYLEPVKGKSAVTSHTPTSAETEGGM